MFTPTTQSLSKKFPLWQRFILAIVLVLSNTTNIKLISAAPLSTDTQSSLLSLAAKADSQLAASDLIFADGFESGNLSAWTASSTNGGMSVSPSAVLVGTNGLQVTFNTTTTMYVRDDSPNAEPRYHARFYFNPNSIAMATGDYDYILQGYSGTANTNILRVQFTRNSVGYQLRARAYDSVLANWVNTPYVTISNTVHYVEADWGNDGHLSFWVDGAQQGSLTGINNNIYTMDSVRLGSTYLSAAATSGTFYIDAFESRRTTYIGSMDASTPITTWTATPTQNPIATGTLAPTQTAGPTSTPIPNTATLVPTNTLISASPAATNTPIPSPASTATKPPASISASGNGIWISTTELLSLPTSGAAWDKIRSTAYGSWGIPDLKNQDNIHAINTLAGALVYARTGDTLLQSKVRDAIIAAKRTLDESNEWQTTNGVLAAGRQIGAYVISADLISLKNHDISADNEFRSWLMTIRTTKIGTHSRWNSITGTCENAAENWAAHACASRIAASIYLGDTADVDRAALIIHAWSDRAFYPKDGIGLNGYFQHSSSYNSSWICGTESTWTAINPPCVKSGVNIDGALVEDASRGGGCCQLAGVGYSYSWEVMQGLTLSTELLYRTNRYDNPYLWTNSALKRAAENMLRQGWVINNPGKFVPWLLNIRYGTNYPTTSNSDGRYMSWGDWLYQR